MRPRPRISCWDGKPPAWDFESELIAPELDRLTPWLERATERLPLFGSAGVKSIVSGAITHTPDGVYLSGPAPGAEELLDALRSVDRHLPGRRRGKISGAMDGAWPGRDQHARIRSAPLRQLGDRRTIRPKSPSPTITTCIIATSPPSSMRSDASLRKSSLHEKLKAEGAQFSQIFGWERARWYDTARQGRGLLLPTLELVGRRRGGGARGARARRAHGSFDLLEVRSDRARTLTPFSTAHLRQPHSRRRTAASCSPICSTRTASSKARSPSLAWRRSISTCSRQRARSFMISTS